MYIAVLPIDKIRILLNLLKHCSICLFQEVDARLEVLPRAAKDRETDFPNDNHVSFHSNNNLKLPSATCSTAHLGPRSSPNNHFPAISGPPIGVKGIPPIPSTISDSTTLFQDPRETPSHSPGSYCLMLKYRRWSLPLLLEFYIISLIVC